MVSGEVVFCGLDVVVAVFFLVPVGTFLCKTRRCFFANGHFFASEICWIFCASFR